MSLFDMNTEKAWLLTGLNGTGKSHYAKEVLGNPLIMYANEVKDMDYSSVPLETGILIEDLQFKPKVKEILNVIRTYYGKIIITIDRQKNAPKEIKSCCVVKRAGKVNYLRQEIDRLAPNGDTPESMESDIFTLLQEYVKETNRDLVAKKLLFNKPPDTQIITWLNENISPNKLLFIDGRVRRRWNTSYFYEMLAYVHEGGMYGRVNFPKRGSYSKMPKICRRLGLRKDEGYLLKQLIQDKEFVEWAKTKLDNGECRLLGLGEKRRRRKTDPIIPNRNTQLDGWL
jgi:hypothetical protein